MGASTRRGAIDDTAAPITTSAGTRPRSPVVYLGVVLAVTGLVGGLIWLGVGGETSGGASTSATAVAPEALSAEAQSGVDSSEPAAAAELDEKSDPDGAQGGDSAAPGASASAEVIDLDAETEKKAAPPPPPPVVRPTPMPPRPKPEPDVPFIMNER